MIAALFNCPVGRAARARGGSRVHPVDESNLAVRASVSPYPTQLNPIQLKV